MKNLLIYQSTEYDCGPTTLTNAIRYLFDREEIYPDIVKYIMLYCLDSYNEAGEIGKRGTSASAMMFLSNWLTQFGQMKNFPISCSFFSKMTSFSLKTAVSSVPCSRAVLSCSAYT